MHSGFETEPHSGHLKLQSEPIVRLRFDLDMSPIPTLICTERMLNIRNLALEA